VLEVLLGEVPRNAVTSGALVTGRIEQVRPVLPHVVHDGYRVLALRVGSHVR
jgi:hypothetical protein